MSSGRATHHIQIDDEVGEDDELLLLYTWRGWSVVFLLDVSHLGSEQSVHLRPQRDVTNNHNIAVFIYGYTLNFRHYLFGMNAFTEVMSLPTLSMSSL
jgi:hypothetical protein